MRAAAIGILLSAMTGSAFANGGTFDTSAVQRTGNLEPVRQNKIELAEESLHVVIDGEFAEVEVDYLLVTRGGATELTYGFPVDVGSAANASERESLSFGFFDGSKRPKFCDCLDRRRKWRWKGRVDRGALQEGLEPALCGPCQRVLEITEEPRGEWLDQEAAAGLDVGWGRARRRDGERTITLKKPEFDVAMQKFPYGRADVLQEFGEMGGVDGVRRLRITILDAEPGTTASDTAVSELFFGGERLDPVR